MTQDPPGFAYHLLRSALEKFGRGPHDLSPNERAVARTRAERSFAIESAVLATSEAARIELPDGRLEEAVATIEGRYDSREACLIDLRHNGLDEDALRQALRREIVFDAAMNLVAVAVAPATEDDARAYYDSHADTFDVPETRVVRQILITINPDYPDNEREAARRRVEAIAENLAADPHRFEEEAQRHSECPSALEGGLLGQTPRGKLHPEIDRVLFGLTEGEVGGPVETEVGFHLIRCDAIYRARHVPFGEVSDQLIAKLIQQRRRHAQKLWLEKIGALT